MKRVQFILKLENYKITKTTYDTTDVQKVKLFIWHKLCNFIIRKLLIVRLIHYTNCFYVFSIFYEKFVLSTSISRKGIKLQIT